MALKMLPPPPPTNQNIDSRQFRDWFYTVFSQTNGNVDQLGTMATQNSNNISVTGGNISNTNLSNILTPGLTGYLKAHNTSPVTASPTIPYTDITGTPTGLSVTITTAKLTTLGSNGSMTFTNGILTAQTQAT
jgi:hypothetical protein